MEMARRAPHHGGGLLGRRNGKARVVEERNRGRRGGFTSTTTTTTMPLLVTLSFLFHRKGRDALLLVSMAIPEKKAMMRGHVWASLIQRCLVLFLDPEKQG